MIEDFDIKALDQKMDKSMDSLTGELDRIRTGRAHPSLLDHISVESYGTSTPLNQITSITVEESRTLVLSVWDKGNINAIEKAISASDLGLNPVVKGMVMRIPMPPLTEERRNELIKVVRHQGEAAKVAIRNIRRDAIRNLKSSEASKDEEKSVEGLIDKLTATKTQKVDTLLAGKEKELATV